MSVVGSRRWRSTSVLSQQGVALTFTNKTFVLLELTAAVLLRKQKMDKYKSPEIKWMFEEIRFVAYRELDEKRVKKLNMMLQPTADLPSVAQGMETSLLKLTNSL